jgi:uncharacterized membrane protein YqjE
MPDSISAKTNTNAAKATVQHPNLLSGLSGVGRNALGLMFNRIELAAFELSEVRVQLLKLIVIGALALMAAGFAVAYWSALVVLTNWDTLGWRILAIVAGFFSIVAIALALAARTLLKNRLVMPETIGELRKDRDALLS